MVSVSGASPENPAQDASQEIKRMRFDEATSDQSTDLEQVTDKDGQPVKKSSETSTAPQSGPVIIIAPPAKKTRPVMTAPVIRDPIVTPPKQNFPKLTATAYQIGHLKQVDLPPELFNSPAVSPETFNHLVELTPHFRDQGDPNIQLGEGEQHLITEGRITSVIKMILVQYRGIPEADLTENYHLNPDDTALIKEMTGGLDIDTMVNAGYALKDISYWTCRLNNSGKFTGHPNDTFTENDVTANKLGTQALGQTKLSMLSVESFNAIQQAIDKIDTQPLIAQDVINAFLLVKPQGASPSAMTQDWTDNISAKYGVNVNEWLNHIDPFTSLPTPLPVSSVAEKLIFRNNIAAGRSDTTGESQINKYEVEKIAKYTKYLIGPVVSPPTLGSP